MNLFLDANILVTVLNKEYPLFSYTARILSLSDNPRFKLFTSPVCLAIAFYFAEKKSGSKIAKQKIALLASKLQLATIGKKEVLNALHNKKVNDFEDGMQFYAAKSSGCNMIISNDTDDFYFSDIEVLGPKHFVEKYLLK